MKAVWNGAVIAESADTVVVEGNHYFPASALKPEFTRPSGHTTVCPWKGTAHYYDIAVHGKVNKDAAWYYPAPSAAAKAVADRVAFWKGIEILP